MLLRTAADFRKEFLPFDRRKGQFGGDIFVVFTRCTFLEVVFAAIVQPAVHL